MTATSEATAVHPTTTGADRYPGVLPFGDTPLDWLRFFGREDESRALLHQLLSVDLLVFFGRSGVGKTSLLKAALFPLLRKRDFLPLPIRFNESGTPLKILQRAVAEACESEQIDYTAGTNGSLWEFFKTAIFWRDDRVQTPVLLLDQFEEVFTIQSEEFRRALAAELGQLTISRLPEHLRHRPVGREPEIGASQHLFTEKPPEMKILIGLREDYLGALQEFAPAVPEILGSDAILVHLLDIWPVCAWLHSHSTPSSKPSCPMHSRRSSGCIPVAGIAGMLAASVESSPSVSSRLAPRTHA